MGQLVLPGSTGIRHSGCVGEHLHLENSPGLAGAHSGLLLLQLFAKMTKLSDLYIYIILWVK